MARHYSRQYQWQHECKYRSGWAQPPVKRVSVLLRNGNNAILHRLEQGYSRLLGCKDLSHSLVSPVSNRFSLPTLHLTIQLAYSLLYYLLLYVQSPYTSLS